MLSWPELMKKSSKVIALIDVGGSEKYAKSNLKGLSVRPDYVLVVIDALDSANKDCVIEEKALNNLHIAFAFQVPVIIVLTKIESIDREILEEIVYELRTQIWEIGNKVGNVIHNKKDIIIINQ